MKLSIYHWLGGVFLAFGVHALAFAAMGTYEQPAMIERSVGPILSVAGSLSSYSIQAEEDSSQDASELEESEPAKVVEEVVEEEVETAELVEENTLQPIEEAEVISSIEPEIIEQEKVIPTNIIRKQAIKKRRHPKIKRQKTQKPKAKKKRSQKKKPASQHKSDSRKGQGKKSGRRRRGKAKTGRHRGDSKTKAGRRGGGGGGRQSKVAGRAAMSNFKGRVRARIAGRSRRASGRGTVVIRFTITSRGGVTSARIVRGAGPVLNAAALRAVRGGFPPIPRGGPKRMTFTIPISFR